MQDPCSQASRNPPLPPGAVAFRAGSAAAAFDPAAGPSGHGGGRTRREDGQTPPLPPDAAARTGGGTAGRGIVRAGPAGPARMTVCLAPGGSGKSAGACRM